jgi:hypothetical protein
MSTAPNLKAVDAEVYKPSAGSMIDDADAKLDALTDLLWLLVEAAGLEGGRWASICHTLEDVRGDLKHARDLLEVRP